MFYLQLSHLYEVLPEGHNPPALETSELCEGRFKISLETPQHKYDTAAQFHTHSPADLSSQTLRVCQTSSGTVAGAPLPGLRLCSSSGPSPGPCWSSRSQQGHGLVCTEGPDKHINHVAVLLQKEPYGNNAQPW